MGKERLNKQKNRNLNFVEFFEILQIEYIVSELRSLIYPKGKDKKYYKEKEMKGKREKIIKISSKNKFKDIFNDTITRDLYYRRVYNDWGLPNFVYRDELDKESRSKSDVFNYFKIGLEVSVKLRDSTIIKGVVVFVDFEKGLVKVKTGEQKYLLVPYEMVSRMINFR